ncbi:hypothetical protein [Nocardia sp. NPDC127526]|uniref:hypothetical protein n=1 Tax=Nocardia sp. NPDC127526 TaxID=3345393 RepID=UPI00362FDDCA
MLSTFAAAAMPALLEVGRRAHGQGRVAVLARPVEHGARSDRRADTGAVDSAERDSQDRSPAVCRYRVWVEMPPPDDYLFDEATALFELEVTSPYLPRIGEELSFQGVDGKNLEVTVTGVTHTFHTIDARSSRLATSVVAQVQAHTLALGHRLLVDPELLVRWATNMPGVEVVPIPILAELAVEYRRRHP